MNFCSYTFSHAVTRTPSASIVDGLRAVDIGMPDLDVFRQHHVDYIEALESTGATVTVLDELGAFPDSVFVEDAALCLPEAAVMMRPAEPSRRDEPATIRPTLAGMYENICTLEGLGFIEGGDILTTATEILVGTSARTNAAGIEELREVVRQWGYTVREVATPPGVLHFKTDCALLDEETILSTKRLAVSGCFDGYKVIHVADGEEASANCIRFNELVIVPAGFPETADRLDQAGYSIREVGNSEAAKLDGGMSCLSLRFSPNGR